MDQGEGSRNQSRMFDTGYTDDYAAARYKALLRQSQTHRGEMRELIEVLAHERSMRKVTYSMHASPSVS